MKGYHYLMRIAHLLNVLVQLLRCTPRDAGSCRLSDIVCGREAVPFRARPWCGTPERVTNDCAGGGTATVSLEGEIGLGCFVFRREGPTVGAAEEEAPCFKGLQRVAEPGVVDAEPAAQGSPGDG